ncbi:MAG: hypothetical protein BRC44_00100 [Cyanobacteria bacterium QS_4_48_99]|nr:MAG: hypothetical protein BRC44_00100 [Cyanobacteria bacterium QS_4_48_99]
MPIPTLLLLLAIAIALGLLSPKHLGALVAWLLLGTVLFGMAAHAYRAITEGGASPEDFLLRGAFVAIGSLFLLKITLPRPVWRKLWHDGIEKVLRSGLSLLGRLVGRSLRRF